MRLNRVSVRKYRSIDTAADFNVGDFTVLVGPNNQGKSNLLRAAVLAKTADAEAAYARQRKAVLDPVEQQVAKAESSGTVIDPGMEKPFGVPAEFGDYFKLMTDMLFIAFKSDLTRVATVMIGREGGVEAQPPRRHPYQRRHDPLAAGRPLRRDPT